MAVKVDIRSNRHVERVCGPLGFRFQLEVAPGG